MPGTEYALNKSELLLCFKTEDYYRRYVGGRKGGKKGGRGQLWIPQGPAPGRRSRPSCLPREETPLQGRDEGAGEQERHIFES